MDNIIVIMGDNTEQVVKELNGHYNDTVRVLNYFVTLEEFFEYYKERNIRVDRIVITESAFKSNPFEEMVHLKEALRMFFWVKFKQLIILTTNDEQSVVLTEDLLDCEEIGRRNLIEHYIHNSYSQALIINYCLGKKSEKYKDNAETEYSEIRRKRVDGEDNYLLDDSIENTETEKVVITKDSYAFSDLNKKLRNLNSVSDSVKNESWKDDRIIRDLMKLTNLVKDEDELVDIRIDYSLFENSAKIKEIKNNLYIVTGQKATGKSTLAYAMAKSASTKKKTLLIDYDLHKSGLSFIAESIKDLSMVLTLQSFKEDYKKSIEALANSTYRFNMILTNSKTESLFSDINPMNFLNMVIDSCSKYFDVVILDISLEDLYSVSRYINNAQRVLFTVPLDTPSIISFYKDITDNSFDFDFVNLDPVIVPMANHPQIKGITTLKRVDVRNWLNSLFNADLKVSAILAINSFNLGEEFFDVMKKL